MNADDYFQVGLVLKPHGLKGEVTISLEDCPFDLANVDMFFLLAKDNAILPYFIESMSVRGTKAFVKFEDVNDPESATKISKRPILLPKSLRPKSAKGQFYDDEIQSFEVWDQRHDFIGKVTGVIQTGSNKLLTVNYNGKEVLIPVNAPLIRSINKSKMKILVDLPEGFLEL